MLWERNRRRGYEEKRVSNLRTRKNKSFTDLQAFQELNISPKQVELFEKNSENTTR